MNSISSKHHDQGGKRNGNQENPQYQGQGASPSRVYFDRKTYALARIRLYDGIQNVMSDKQWQRAVARIFTGQPYALWLRSKALHVHTGTNFRCPSHIIVSSPWRFTIAARSRLPRVMGVQM